MNKKSVLQRCPRTVCATAMMLSAIFSIYSCTQNDQESGGYECLAKSRAYLADNNHKEARNMIDSLRNGYPMAFNAREEGILLLDSIEISQAKYDLENATKRLELSDNAICQGRGRAKNQILYQETYSRQEKLQAALNPQQCIRLRGTR